MKNYPIILLFSIFSAIICPAEEKNGAVFMLFSNDKEFKINGRTVLYDLSDDAGKYIKKYKTPEDLMKSGKFIYKKEEIEKYAENIAMFSGYLKVAIEKLTDNNITLVESGDISEVESGFIIDVKLLEYTEGEYNLIKNRNSIIKLLVKLHEKSSKDTIILLKVDTVSCKSGIEYPTEKMRLENISDKTAKSLLIFIKNYNISNKKK
jgi:hypothetical protein